MAWQPRLSMANIISSPRSVVDANETVVLPAGLGVVIGDAVSHQRLVIRPDETALDVTPQLRLEAGAGEVGEVSPWQADSHGLPVDNRDPRAVRVEQHVVESIVAVHQCEPFRLGLQPRGHRSH
jgi:hypothetical protein